MAFSTLPSARRENEDTLGGVPRHRLSFISPDGRFALMTVYCKWMVYNNFSVAPSKPGFVLLEMVDDRFVEAGRFPYRVQDLFGLDTTVPIFASFRDVDMGIDPGPLARTK